MVLTTLLSKKKSDVFCWTYLFKIVTGEMIQCRRFASEKWRGERGTIDETRLFMSCSSKLDDTSIRVDRFLYSCIYLKF